MTAPQWKLGLWASFLLVIGSSSAQAQARTWVVAEQGGDFKSIQAAIFKASSGDRIEVGPGVYRGVFSFMGKDLQLVAQAGPSQTYLIGEAGSRVLSFTHGESRASLVQGFRIMGRASSGEGGAVRIENASPTVRQCDFVGSSATRGGAVYVQGGQSNPLITENRFVENFAQDSGGGIEAAGGHLVLTGNLFLDNEAVGAGGAVHTSGGAATLANNILAGNRASFGGALAIQAGDSQLLEHNTFLYNYGLGQGDHLYGPEGEFITIRDNIFAFSGVGTSLVLPSSLPSSRLQYNLLYDPEETALDVRWHTSGNRIQDPEFQTLTPGDGFWDDTFLLKASSPCRASGSPVLALRNPDGSRSDIGATGGPGGMPVTEGEEGAEGAEAALEVSAEAPVGLDPLGWSTRTAPSWTRSRVNPTARTINVPQEYTTIQDAINSSASGDTILVSPGTYTVTRALNFLGKQLILKGDQGASVTVLSGNSSSGLIELRNAEPAGTKVIGFTLRNGKPNNLNGNVTGGGGAIFLYGTAQLEVEDSILSANTTNVSYNNASGGAAHVDAGGNPAGAKLTFTNCLLVDNSSLGYHGGAVFVRNKGRLVLTNSVLVRSYARASGGTVYAEGSDVVLNRVTIVESRALAAGGAVYGTGSSVSVSQSQVFNSFALLEGGAIAAVSGGSLVSTNTLYSGNRSGLKGGAIFARSTPTTLNFNTIVENAAALDGGNLYFETSTLNINHNLIAYSAGGEGIYLTGGSLSSFTYNNVFGNHTANYTGMSSTLPTNLSVEPKLGAFVPGGTILSGTTPTPTAPILSAVSAPGSPYMLNNFVPASTSPLVNAGNPQTAYRDTDGSNADIGFTGGPSALTAWHLDSDSDGLSDGYELTVGLNTQVADSSIDSDGDGANNLAEEAAATRPFYANTYVPPDLLVPQQYSTIQAAIDAATSNQTIRVACGTYLESLSLKGKALRLIGASSGCTSTSNESILDGTYSPSNRRPLLVNTGEASNTYISDFTFRKGLGDRGGAIQVYGARLTVERCKFTQNETAYGGDGLAALQATVTVRKSYLYSNGRNVSSNGGALQGMTSARLTVEDSEIASNVGGPCAGICLLSGGLSTFILKRNYIHDNASSYCGGAGIRIENSGTLTARNNRVVHNRCITTSTVGGGAGLYSVDSARVYLYNNTFVDNYLEPSNNILGKGSNLYVNGATYDIQNNVIAFGRMGAGIHTYYTTTPSWTFKGNDVYQNVDSTGLLANYSGTMTEQTGLNFNLNSSPRFSRFVSNDTANNSLVPAGNSPVRNARSDAAAFLDPDSSATDLGYTGGPDASLTFFTDTDQDGLTDGYESSVLLNPASAADALQDLDGEGLLHLQEYQVGGDIRKTDTDGDHVSDKLEFDNSTDVQSPDDYRPIANAGADAHTLVGTSTTVVGAGTDANGDPLTYQWTLTAKPAGSTLTSASLSGATTATVTFTPDVIGFYTLQLVVSDSFPSLPDTVSIQANGTLSYPSASYASLQAAIDSLYDGDTLQVGPGTYTGLLDLKGKAIHLVSTGGPEVTILRGNNGRILEVDQGEEAATEIEGFTLTGGYSSRDGGAIYVVNSHLKVTRCYFLENRAFWSGSALYGSGATIILDQVRFVGNQAESYHGTVAVNTSSLTAEQVQFVSNQVKGQGGALYGLNSTLLLTGGLFAGNRAVNEDGGGILVSGGTFTASNLVVSGNKAGRSGGGIALVGGNPELANIVVIDNLATIKGGGIFATGSTAKIQGVVIAWSSPGGIYTESGTPSVFAYNDVYGNMPSNYGGTLTDKTGLSGNLSVDPGFFVHDPSNDISADRLWLSESALEDAGNPASSWNDPDNTTNDIGAFGGPGAQTLDLDLDGSSRFAGDCDDQDAFVHPGTPEYLDGRDNDCDGQTDESMSTTDGDGDGWSRSQGDCDDSSAARNPGALELFNAVDDNCDGIIDEQTAGMDDDGDGVSEVMGDCNDHSVGVAPGAVETCDGEDDDCDGVVDDGVTIPWYIDLDGDSYGAQVGSPIQACAAPPVPGYSTHNDDCDDTNPATHPGAPDVTDGQDNNCNGQVDEGQIDADGDGYSPLLGDCNDNNANIAPGMAEGLSTDPTHYNCLESDGIDNDCDNAIDEGTCAVDDDSDAYSELDGDCDDTRSDVYPNAPEDWEDIDHDCDGVAGLGDADPDLSELEVTPTTVVSDGFSTATVTVIPRNAEGLELGPNRGILILTTGGTLLGTVLDHGDGVYSQALQAPLTSGTAQISAYVDAVLLTTVSAVTFEADETEPQTQLVTGPLEGTNTAASDILFAWRGTDNANTALQFSWRLDGEAWQDPWAAATSTTLSGLAVGAHVFEVRARDLSGNIESTPAIRHFNVAPLPAEVFPVVEAEGSGNDLELDWSSYDEATAGALAYYRVYASSAPFSQVQSAALVGTTDAGIRHMTVTGIPRGTRYYLSVIAVLSGDVARTSVVDPRAQVNAVPVDIEGPASITGLRVESTLQGLTFRWYNSLDLAGDVQSQRLTLANADGSSPLEVSLAPSTNSYEVTGLPYASARRATVVVLDSESTPNQSAPVSTTGVTLLNNPTLQTARAGNTQVTLTWSPADSSPWVAGYNVYVSSSTLMTTGLGERLPVLTRVQGTTATVMGLANDQTYYFTVATVNSSGGVNPVVTGEKTATPAADDVPPVISGVTWADLPLLDDTIISARNMLRGSASDAASGVTRVTAALRDAATGTVSTVGTVTSGTFQLVLDPANFADGSYVLELTAVDGRGNESVSRWRVQLSLAIPPPPLILSPVEGVEVTTETIVVSGTATPGAEVLVQVGGNPQGSPAVASGTGTFSTLVGLQEGGNVLSAVARNRAGASASSPTVRILRDTEPPAPPRLLEATARAGGEIDLTWQPPASGETPVGYFLYRSAAPFTSVQGMTPLNQQINTSRVYTDVPAPPGTYTYGVISVDEAGNHSTVSANATATSDTAAPRLTSYSLVSSGNTAGNTVGLSQHVLTLTVSEPLAVSPYLSLLDSVGVPLNLSPASTVGSQTYRTTFQVTATTASGPLTLRWSGRDRVGNVGTGIDFTFPLVADTRGPVGQVTSTPQAPLQNSSAAPLSITLTLGLDEPVAAGTVPVLKATTRYRTTVDTLTLQPAQGQTWTTVYTLPPSAGSQPGDWLQLGIEARDALNNAGTLATPSRFEIYQGDLPPSPTPSGLIVDALKGGKAALEWSPVPGASAYQVYRRGPGQAQASLLVRQTETALVDPSGTASLPDGSYDYSVASVRIEGSLEAVSEPSAPVAVQVDGTAPAAPSELTLVLEPQGVVATWQAPDEDSVTFALYRASTPEMRLEDATLVEEDLIDTRAIDPYPSSLEQYYAVVALDEVGNTSSFSAWVDLNLDSLPVREVLVQRTVGHPPVLHWSHESQVLSGFKISVVEASGTVPLHEGLWTSRSFEDLGWAGEARTYEIVAVDSDGVESLPRQVTLPALTAGLQAGALVRRGQLNQVGIQVVSSDTVAFELARMLVRYAETETSPVVTAASGPVSVLPGETAITSVILGGESTLPDELSLNLQAELEPEPGVKVEISQVATVYVLDGTMPLEVHPESLVKGSDGLVSFVLHNTGPVEIQLVTALDQDSPSDEVTVALLDQAQSQVLVQAPLAQWTGGVVRSISGRYVAIIPAGGIFTSQPVRFALPLSLPDDLVAQVQISHLHTAVGTPSDLTASGPQAQVNVSLDSLPYAAQVEQVGYRSTAGDFVESSRFRSGDTVFLRGRAWSTQETTNPMPYAPLKVWYQNQGALEAIDVVSDLDGEFEVWFKPLEPGTYSTWAGHPELSERPVQRQLQIDQIYIAPSLSALKIGRGSMMNHTITLTNAGNTVLPDVFLSVESIVNTETNTPITSGVTAAVLANPTDLPPGVGKPFTVQLAADATAPDEVEVRLEVHDRSSTRLWGTARIAISTHDAQASLKATPTSLTTGMNPATSLTRYISFENQGFATAAGIQASLIAEAGQTLPSWMSLSTPSSLGDLAVGASAQIGMTFMPPASLEDGVYHARLQVTSTTTAGATIPISVTVTSGTIGSGFVHLVDAYYNETAGVFGVNGATVTLQHTTVPTVTYTASTGSDSRGLAQFQGITAARYNYHASAPGHADVSGVLDVRPGVDTSIEAIMELATISYQWSVTETTVEDNYTITLNAEYQTDVPVPVIVIEPAGIALPELAVGASVCVNYSITNYGLIRGEDFELLMPTGDPEYVFTLMTPMPDAIEAKQQLSARVCIQRIGNASGQGGTGGSGGGNSGGGTSGNGGGGGTGSGSGSGAGLSCNTLTITARARYCSCPLYCRNGPNASMTTVSQVQVPRPCPESDPAAGGQGGTSTTGGQAGGGSTGGSTRITKCLYLYLDIPWCEDEGESHSTVNLSSGRYEDWIKDLEVEVSGPNLQVLRGYTGVAAPGAPLGPGWHLWRTLDRMYKTSTDPNLELSIFHETEELSGGASLARFAGARLRCAGPDAACGTGATCSSKSSKIIGMCGEESSNMEDEFQEGTFAFGGAASGGKTDTTGGLELLFRPEELTPDSALAVTLLDSRGNMTVYGPLNATGVEYPLWGPKSGRVEILSDSQGQLVGVLQRYPDGSWRKFDQGGVLVASGDPVGNVTDYEYDGNTRLIRQKSHAHPSRFITFEYDGNTARIVAAEDWRGRRVAYSYDSEHRLIGVTDVHGETFSYTYRSDDYLASKRRPNGEEVRITYVNDQGQVGRVSLLDPQQQELLGKSYTRFFDADGNSVTRITTDEGRWHEVVQNIFGLVLKVQDATGTLFTRSYDYYDDQGTIESIVETRRDGGTWETDLDTLGRKVRTVDPYGGTRRYFYPTDWNGGVNRPSRVETPDGTQVDFVRNALGLVIQMTIASGTEDALVHRFAYDADGNLVAQYLPGDPTDNPTRLWTYNSDGAITGYTERLDDSTSVAWTLSYEFANGVRTATMHDAGGQIWELEFDAGERIREIRDGLSGQVVMRYEYDRNGRKTKEIQLPDSQNQSTFEQVYRAESIVESVFRAKEIEANPTSFVHDRDGRLIQTRDPLNHTTSLELDTQGRPLVMTDPSLNTFLFDYDEGTTECENCSGGDRNTSLSSVVDPLGGVSGKTYDLKGRPIEILEPNGDVMELEYDIMDRLIRRTMADGTEVLYQYNRRSQLKEVTYLEEDRTRTVLIEYDARGQIEAVYDGSDLTEPLYTYTRYRNGWIRTQAYAAGNTMLTRYSPAGDPVEVDQSDGSTIKNFFNTRHQLTSAQYFEAGSNTPARVITYTYDTRGMYSGWSDGQGGQSIERDLLGRIIRLVTTWPGGVEKEMTQSWNSSDRLTGYTIPGGEAITYSYTPLDLVSSISSSIRGPLIQVSAYTWRNASQLSWSDGSILDREYGTDGRLTSLQLRQNGSVALSESYAYSSMGRLEHITQTSGSSDFSYHPSGSLASEYSSDGQRDYTYDDSALVKRIRVTGDTSDWEYASGSRLMHHGNITFTYDTLGRPSTRSVGGVLSQVYTWTVDGQLAKVEDGHGTLLAEFYYDPFGNRMMKTTPNESRLFLYHGGTLLGEYSPDGTVLRTWINLKGMEDIVGPIAQDASGAQHFGLLDARRTPIAFGNGNDGLSWTGRLSAFGNLSAGNGTFDQPLRLLGQYADTETGLHYNGARYYLPEEGRFLSPDPLGIAANELDAYRYAGADPINQTDPLGLFTIRDGLTLIHLDSIGGTIGVEGGYVGVSVSGYTNGVNHRVCVGFGRGVQTAPVLEFNPDIPSRSTSLTAGAEVGLGVAAVSGEGSLTYDWEKRCFDPALEGSVDLGPFSVNPFALGEGPSYGASHPDEWSHDMKLSVSLTITHCF